MYGKKDILLIKLVYFSLIVTFTGLDKHTSLPLNQYFTKLYCFVVQASAPRSFPHNYWTSPKNLARNKKSIFFNKVSNEVKSFIASAPWIS
jgi:hypothetical protein